MIVPDQATPFERELTDRLRSLAAHAPTEPTMPLSTTAGPGDRLPSRPGRPRTRILAAAAALILIGAGVAALSRLGDEAVPLATVPDDFGRWSPMAEAPITGRPFAATGWTGTEAVFWAGSNLGRSFAHTDGAAYDPATDTWRAIATPGWGHPGLSGTSFEGELYVVAKGGGSRYDPVAGTWTDLAQVEGLILASAVATEDRVYGIGPRTWDGEGALDVGVTPYDPVTESWGDPVFYSGPALRPDTFDYGFLIERPVVWTGSEIVVWQNDGTGLAFDPAAASWRVLPPLDVPVGPDGPFSVAAGAGGELAVLAADPVTGQGRLALLGEDGWRWDAEPLPLPVGEDTTLASAGDWLVVLSPVGSPVVHHVPSGRSYQDADGPMVQAPNTVWTGDELVVWGGVDPGAASAEDGSGGHADMVWTPPVEG